MLRPLAFDEALANRVGRGPQADGYRILRNALLEMCVHDIVKLTLDGSSKAPSVRNLMESLRDESIRWAQREDYGVAPPLLHAGPGDPLSDDVVAEMRAAESAGRLQDFDATWVELADLWARLEASGQLKGFKAWRDKVIAHADLYHIDGEYKLTDLSTLGLNWGDLGAAIQDLQEVVERIGVVTRGASFAWDVLDRQVQDSSARFWALVRAADPDHGAR